jgi:hypothetical protein
MGSNSKMHDVQAFRRTPTLHHSQRLTDWMQPGSSWCQKAIPGINSRDKFR